MLHGLDTPSLAAELECTPGWPAPDGGAHAVADYCRQRLPQLQPWLERADTLGADVWTARQGCEAVADLAWGLLAYTGWPVSRPMLSRSATGFWLLLPCFNRVSGAAAVAIALRLVGEALQRLTPGAGPPPSPPFAKWVQPRLAELKSELPLPNTIAFAQAAGRRNIPWFIMGEGVLQLGYGVRQRRFKGSFTDRTSSLATHLARHKHETKALLAAAGLPVAEGSPVESAREAVDVARKLGFPVAVKPSAQDQGLGISLDLNDAAEVAAGYRKAAAYGKQVLVEKMAAGKDFRLLVVNGRLLAAAQRIPAGVTGDGRHTVEELVAEVNRDPRRGTGKAPMIRIELDDDARSLLEKQGLRQGSVPPEGSFVRLRSIANVSAGGIALDVPVNRVHEQNRILAERVARILSLDIVGIDLLIDNLDRPWNEAGGVICEVNAQPGFRPHWLADPGRDLNGEILDMCCGADGSRIPIVAVADAAAGELARSLQRVLGAAGGHCGVETRNGIWLDGLPAGTGATAGQPGGRALLMDPGVEVAVIELTSEGLAAAGFAFDRCTMAVLRRIQPAGGADGAPGLVHELVDRTAGPIVVNAADEACLQAVAGVAPERLVLVGLSGENKAIERHLSAGGVAFTGEVRGGRPAIVRRQADRAETVLLADAGAGPAGGLPEAAWTDLAMALAVAWEPEFGDAEVPECLVQAGWLRP